MNSESLIGVWDGYYAESSDTAIKDRPFFELEVQTLVGRLRAEAEARGPGRLRVLELGSGTGFLAERITEGLEPLDLELRYDGVDFSEVGVQHAVARELPGCAFHTADFIAFIEAAAEPYDVIVTQRSIIAVMEAADQNRLLELLRDRLAPGGLGLFSEGSVQGLARLNELRQQLELEPLEKVWHSRYLDEDELARIFDSVETEHFAPLYWLITRVVYPFLEEPRHDTPLHRFAATLPQSGDYSPVRLFAVRA